MPIFKVAQTNYHVATAGGGPPLMLLHGFTGSAESWQHLVPHLAGHFSLVMPDLIGHGATDSPPDAARYTIESSIADLVGIMDAMDIACSHLLGYSMGGRVALAAALQYPARFESLMLESASPGLAHETERQSRIKGDNELARLIEREGLEAFVARWERNPLFSTQQRLPESVRARLRAQRLRGNPVGLANSLRGMGTGVQAPLWNRLGALKLPCLLMAGGMDLKFVDILQRMGALIADAQLVIVNGCGHAIHLEQPQTFERLVIDFAGAPDKPLE